MYSREERMKAIELFIKYDKHTTKTVRELGYPSGDTLVDWYKAYLEKQETGITSNPNVLFEKYPLERKLAAVDHYFENGCNLSKTIKELGYPSIMGLCKWCDRYRPGVRKRNSRGILYSQEQKEEVVLLWNTGVASLKELAKEYGVIQGTIRIWQKNLLGEEERIRMPKIDDRPLPADKEALLAEIEELQKQIRKYKLETALWKGAAELIKKDPGVDPKYLTNKEKTILVDALRNEYTLKELLDRLELAVSSYFYQHNLASMPDKYEELRGHIKELFAENGGRYGYRRIQALLVREGSLISEKVVQRIMKECDLLVSGKRKRKYNSYQGENAPGAENRIERNFYADKPNVKWLTDITEFAIPAGKVYLSPIVDCFDGFLPSWTIGTSPNAELVNSMLDQATETLQETEHPLVHSDRGGHYRWPGWLERMEKAGLERSMSKKGCSPDNAACEGLFGRIKNEMFYNRTWQGIGIGEFIKILNGYLIWYNEKRIKMSLGAMSPLEFRQSLELAT